jgi:hypothetical protein
MPGVDPPWSQPQITQYCVECERLWRVNDVLKSDIAEMVRALVGISKATAFSVDRALSPALLGRYPELLG